MLHSPLVNHVENQSGLQKHQRRLPEIHHFHEEPSIQQDHHSTRNIWVGLQLIARSAGRHKNKAQKSVCLKMVTTKLHTIGVNSKSCARLGRVGHSSEGGWRWRWWRRMVWGADRWAIDLAQHISPAPFTEPITSPAGWCVDNWAVAGVPMFVLQPRSDGSYCTAFYFNTIYNKGHPDVYLCQYPSRPLSSMIERLCIGHDWPLACPG